MDAILWVYLTGALFYGFFVFLFAFPSETIRPEWLYTIPIWPLTVAVLFIRILWRGLKITFEKSA